jgi:peptidyl-dipeptidase Dcp
MKHFILPAALILLNSAYAEGPGKKNKSDKTSKNKHIEMLQSKTSDNPLMADWTGLYGGLPPFDKVKVSDFKPAIEAAMKENLSEIDNIANQTEAPTFSNTIAAMERTGQKLQRIMTLYGIWGSNLSTPEFQEVETEFEPKLAGLSDQINQNVALFKRIETVYLSPETKKLSPEQQRLCKIYFTNFVRSGAKLDATKKIRLSEINQELAGFFTKFSQNLLSDESDLILVLNSKEELAGLPQSLVDGASNTSKSKLLDD